MSTAFRLDATSEQQLVALSRGLRRLRGFGLYEVIADGPARVELLRRLQGWSDIGWIPPLTVWAIAESDSLALQRQLAPLSNAPSFGSLVVTDEVLRDDNNAALRALHLSRDRLPTRISGPLLLVVSPDRQAELLHAAPDLFRVRRSVCVLQVEPVAIEATIAEQWQPPPEQRADPEALARLHQQDQLFRAAASDIEPAAGPGLVDRWLALSREFFTCHDRPAARASARDALLLARRLGYRSGVARAALALADVLRATGQLDEAMNLLSTEVLPIERELGRQRGIAIVWGRMADILHKRGNFDEALRIRREEELPAYERLGDVREKAVTMVKVADILQMRGEWDEALRIYREEAIPVYERLGEERTRAVTVGKVADILQVRGELDEALRIRREEELPVYERLGDVQEKAVAMGKVAAILQARGEVDEALQIDRDETIPVFERLGDMHGKAVAMGRVAHALRMTGDLDGAVRIYREEVVPIYEQLGAVRSLLLGRASLAVNLALRRQEEDRDEIAALLLQAYSSAVELRLPEAATISTEYRKIFGQPIVAAQDQLDPEG